MTGQLRVAMGPRRTASERRTAQANKSKHVGVVVVGVVVGGGGGGVRVCVVCVVAGGVVGVGVLAAVGAG
eukprot:70737-Pyramimonas_sp.AAC.1